MEQPNWNAYYNSKLELAAAVLGHATQLQLVPSLPYTFIYLGTGNLPAQAWITSGSVSMMKAPAFLLRQLALDCCLYHACLTSVFIPGNTNLIHLIYCHVLSRILMPHCSKP